MNRIDGEIYKITVFVTKNKKLRASVSPQSFDGKSFEVTVGGNNWKIGKFAKFERDILIKCEKLVNKLRNELIGGHYKELPNE